MTSILLRFTSWYKTTSNILWLSVSSPDFYCDVHSKYHGYGIKYILNLYLISGLIFSLLRKHSFLTRGGPLNQLLAFEKEMSITNPEVEYVLRQIPDIY